jgi:hypothetical protein
LARVEWNRSVSIAGPAAHSDDAGRFYTSSGACLLLFVLEFARNSPQCPFLCQTQAARAVDCPPLWCFPSNTSQTPALEAIDTLPVRFRRPSVTLRACRNWGLSDTLGAAVRRTRNHREGTVLLDRVVGTPHGTHNGSQRFPRAVRSPGGCIGDDKGAVGREWRCGRVKWGGCRVRGLLIGSRFRPLFLF